MIQRDPRITKNYTWAHQKISFQERNFLVTNWGEKNFLEIGKYTWLQMQNMTQRGPLITKNYIWAHQKINFKNRNILVRNWGQKNFFEIGKSKWPKMQNMTQRDALITKNYIWAHQKIKFKIEIFWSEIEVKKFLWNWKIELAKIAEYDSLWCANHEKQYLSPSKNQILRSKFFV